MPMVMPPIARRVALAAHVVLSVGWLGAIAAFLALAIAGLNATDAVLVRSAYVAADMITWTAIVPLSAAAILTGLVQSLGTSWGLFRHYWVLIKLILTLAAGGLLLLHTTPIAYVANAAAIRVLGSGDLHRVRLQLVGDAVLALLTLIVVTTLSVFKPKGLTPYGYRRQLAESEEGRD